MESADTTAILTIKNYRCYENCISASFLGDVFYHPYRASFDMKVHCLKPKNHELNPSEALFLIPLIRRKMLSSNYFNQTSSTDLPKIRISLPVTPHADPDHAYTPDDIDWAYMERYIAELERERIAELDAYLKAAGLDDCELTAEDEAALAEQPVFAEFKVGELFDVYSPKKRFDANKVKFGGKYPYVARGSANNGIRGRIDEDERYLSPAKSLSFGQDTATVFYQEEPYFTGDKIKVMALRDHELDPALANYLIAAISKAFSGFAWGQSSFNQKILESVALSLPVVPNADPNHVYTSDDIDWAYMERYIRAIEKQVVADVVEYKDKVIETTRTVVGVA